MYIRVYSSSYRFRYFLTARKSLSSLALAARKSEASFLLTAYRPLPFRRRDFSWPPCRKP